MLREAASVSDDRTIADRPGTDTPGRGSDMMKSVRELFPILRSITGPGSRQTLDLIGSALPGFVRRRVPTGTAVLDWTIPKEWSVREAYLVDPDGKRIVDAADNNLHLLQYSVPVDAELNLSELLPHLHSLPDRPDLIPYRTSYYEEDWGFCLPHRQLACLQQGRYHVVIDTSLTDGGLDFGELVLAGDSQDEVLLSAHICHPSMANDNLSAVVVLMEIGRALARLPRRRYRYRLLFAPGTIGAIAFLATTPDAVQHIRHGLVLAGVGDGGTLHYKRSRDGAIIDRVVERVLAEHGPYELLPFTPDGYDERQYNSPGFRLPVGRLSRTPYGTYPEYHTSADDLGFIQAEALEDTFDTLWNVVTLLEHDGVHRNTAPYGEPQLGRRGLYRDLGGTMSHQNDHAALLWLLNLCDGRNSLLDIADRSELPIRSLIAARTLLVQRGLLEPVPSPASRPITQ